MSKKGSMLVDVRYANIIYYDVDTLPRVYV